uniref:Tripartite motif containing 69 n=1 Tax=Lates calcarifer TaxID=8187 RepID=A0A4W6CI44_LATCA
QRERPHSAGEEGRRGPAVPSEQRKTIKNLEKLNQGIKPEKKSWKPKEGEFAMQTAMEKLRQPPIAGQVTKSSAHRISRDLTCSICLDLFKQPVSLPCDHTFCLGCIEGYWTGPRGPGQGGTGSCPQCRKVYPGQSYRPNRIVANIVESYCQGLEESGSGARLADVGVVERVPAPVPRCSRHREELKLYCEEDQELVCLVCGVSQEHRNHTMMCLKTEERRELIRLDEHKALLCTFNHTVQDNPYRFNAALSLLGSQGFTHGRHYWEIEVYSSTVWTVGVARESVPRKGVIKALPANGFWTLSLSYGIQYMAGTSPPTVLSLEEPLARIGVYLDYKRGLVSFYNAESMTHLYTFRENFSETLYPYFNLGFLDKVHENEPLKVFLPKI